MHGIVHSKLTLFNYFNRLSTVGLSEACSCLNGIPMGNDLYFGSDKRRKRIKFFANFVKKRENFLLKFALALFLR